MRRFLGGSAQLNPGAPPPLQRAAFNAEAPSVRGEQALHADAKKNQDAIASHVSFNFSAGL